MKNNVTVETIGPTTSVCAFKINVRGINVNRPNDAKTNTELL